MKLPFLLFPCFIRSGNRTVLSLFDRAKGIICERAFHPSPFPLKITHFFVPSHVDQLAHFHLALLAGRVHLSPTPYPDLHSMFRTPSRILFPSRFLTSPFRQPFSPSDFPPRSRPASSFKDFVDGIVEAVASPGPPMRNWKVRHSKETFEGLREMQSKGDEYKYKPPNANTGVSLCSWSLSLWVE